LFGLPGRQFAFGSEPKLPAGGIDIVPFFPAQSSTDLQAFQGAEK
jgi:hypothetical protein